MWTGRYRNRYHLLCCSLVTSRREHRLSHIQIAQRRARPLTGRPVRTRRGHGPSIGEESRKPLCTCTDVVAVDSTSFLLKDRAGAQ